MRLINIVSFISQKVKHYMKYFICANSTKLPLLISNRNMLSLTCKFVSFVV